MATKIEWTEKTYNPVTGCTKVSAGCEHCYAERMAKRFAGRFGYPADDPFRVTLHPDKLTEPLHWKKPCRIFPCSMSDLFHEDVPFEFTHRVFVVMMNAKRHFFQVLTKRPGRLLAFCEWESVRIAEESDYVRLPLPNVHLGVTVENQDAADERIPILLQTPAAVRFISAEPMLGPVDVTPYVPRITKAYTCPSGDFCPAGIRRGLDWVIAGGESGPGARPMHPDWVRDLRDQCTAANVPFFFKQWGAYAPGDMVDQATIWRFHKRYSYGHSPPEAIRYAKAGGTFVPAGDGCCGEYTTMYRVGKKKAGRMLDGRTWDEYPKGAI